MSIEHENLPATGATVKALQERLARYDAALDRARMERAEAEDAETAATARAEAAEATLAKVRALADEAPTMRAFGGETVGILDLRTLRAVLDGAP